MNIANSISGDQSHEDNPSSSEHDNKNVIEREPSDQLGNLITSMSSGIDPKMLQMLMKGMQELDNKESDQVHALIHALQPFLKDERKAKLDKAMQIAKLSRVARMFFKGMSGGDDLV